MEIAIIGSGAIGGVLGAYLTRAGEQVVFCDIVKEHVDYINGTGLTIEGEEAFTVQGEAYTPEHLLQRGKPLDMVFLCVKGQHTETAMRQIMPLLTEQSAVVSFQNGLCENIISELIGKERTIGCFVNFSADYLEPGRILYGGVSSLFLGELDGTISERILDLQRRLACWGPVNVTDNIWGYLWGKLSYIALLYATALADEAMADVVRNRDLREVLMELCSEVLEVAEKENVCPMGFDDWEPALVYPRGQRNSMALDAQLEKLSERMATNKKTKSGIWRDLAVRKRKTELEFQLKPILDIGLKYGLTLPLVSHVTRFIRELENGERVMDWKNLYDLKAVYDERRSK
ncbi:2-dehydropantoate 2-reductase N-terminal domain-containing protein [Paenibacillus sp. GP183]|jgi:2-dehydropantoate 2-reductase|uniref:ketopantoate reductase family protein n=1 Tax=Paenibacillus sp. GP183 TaxID=1882751 RepID=UPI00089D1845|nr:2-dehydropantoate 2-reductase N-terminal domain-containing protein [Paenibacillus sp. GP183]SEB73238.1 ketopantoate reductase [Paenibacillus sp. GP183]